MQQKDFFDKFAKKTGNKQKNTNMATFTEAFAVKETENGDLSYTTTGNKYADLLFMGEYYTNNPDEAKGKIGKSEHDKLFAMFIRDPRLGLGMKTYGRMLMSEAEVSAEDIVKAGRYDDLLYPTPRFLDFWKQKVEEGSYHAKKWCPRFTSGLIAKQNAVTLSKAWGMDKQSYGRFVKIDTTERLLTERRTDEIEFEKVPSLAAIKYARRFSTGEDTSERYAKYMESVKNGEKKINVATASVYDIYKNRYKIDADLFFGQIEKIAINAIPVVDTSGSMVSQSDELGKAISIGHYIAKCSTFMKDRIITFSSRPEFVDFSAKTYQEEVNRIYYNSDCSNTDFGKVMECLSKIDKNNMPEYIVVLSDMEFDYGSNTSKNELQKMWNENGYTTKIVWWNLNNRNKTVPEMDNMGNIFLSGYNPMVLKYLESGFNADKFIDKLLRTYKKNIGKDE